MATISVSSKSFIRPWRNVRTTTLKEEASQTFVLGAVLVQDATAKNEIEEAGSDPTARIVGVAAQAASGTADTQILFYEADEDAEFVGHIEDAATVVVGNLGTNYGLVKDSTNNIWRVDTSDTTNVNVTVTGFPPADEPGGGLGDVNGRVIFKFLAAARGIFKG